VLLIVIYRTPATERNNDFNVGVCSNQSHWPSCASSGIVLKLNLGGPNDERHHKKQSVSNKN